jgi:hypothetical protein
MNDSEILKEVKQYFCIEEFVSESVFNKYGQNAWQFICPRLLHTMLIIRKEANASITINNWKWGGKFSQRGLRENTSEIVSKRTKRNSLYLSAHTMGKAVDFDIKGMEAPKVRSWLKNNADKLPYKIRLENEFNGKQIGWVHLDVFSNDKNPHVYLFNI